MAFRIGKNFHIIHMSDDLRELDGWYYDIFSVQRFMPDSYGAAEVRDASLVLIGDLCIETLAPGVPGGGLGLQAAGALLPTARQALSFPGLVRGRGDGRPVHRLIGAGRPLLRVPAG